MRIVFFGSDDFAGVCLKELMKSSHKVIACVTKPDAPKGRGMQIVLSPIKEIALAQGIICLQPESLKEPSVIEALKAFEADLFVVVAYGKILSQEVLDIPKKLCVNVHGSLLPKYRGAAPINWAIINGDQETGVTIMKMNAKMDAGDIISQKVIPLSESITSDFLRQDMARVGAEFLVTTLGEIERGTNALKVQDESQVTIAHKLTKEMGRIDWKLSADEIEHRIRGLKPWPGTYCGFKGKILKILKANVVVAKAEPSKIIEINKDGFVVACGQNGLLIRNVHLEASKPVSADDFVQGHRLVVGQRFE
jgi:methionyl-tRNA formyltransferase